MADVKISELPAAGALDGTEEVPVVQAATTKKTTTQEIADLGGGGGTPSAPDTAIQFNDGGAFGGSTFFTFDKILGHIALGNSAVLDAGKTFGLLEILPDGVWSAGGLKGIDLLVASGAATENVLSLIGQTIIVGQNSSLSTPTMIKGLDILISQAGDAIEITAVSGLHVEVQDSGVTNTVGTVIGIEIFTTAPAGAIITNMYGIFIENQGGGSLGVINNYGIYIDDQSASGSINSYNLYSVGASSKNKFEGSVEVGTTLKVGGNVVPGGHGAAVAIAGAATLDQGSGIITSEALVGAVGYTLTLTNNKILATSTVLVTATNSANLPVTINTVTEADGSVVITVGMAALTGTVIIRFAVFN